MLLAYKEVIFESFKMSFHWIHGLIEFANEMSVHDSVKK